jgi:apolipoprotein D and lipocalin family protein
MARKGMGYGTGKGYKNLAGSDPKIHSQSSKGIKQPQKYNILGFKQRPQLQTVKKLDVKKYSGKWYEIQSMPAWFQSGLKDVIAEYKLKKGYIEVKNSGINKEGKRQFAYAKAYPTDKTNSKLKVDFGFWFDGDYQVIYIDKDYKHAVVGTPNRDYLWILSRTPEINNNELALLRSKAKEQGFKISSLKKRD